MKNKIFYCVGCVSLLLSSCSPRVITSVTKNYPPLSADSVLVFLPGEPVPNEAEEIGTVAVVDRGTTTKCSYNYVVKLAREETAKNGGNGLWITDHSEPSVWRSSCHQISGKMLYLTDISIDPSAPNPLVEKEKALRQTQMQLQREAQQKMQAPNNTIIADVGYGWILSKIYTPLNEYKGKGGMQWRLVYEHVFRGGLGFGLEYSDFSTDFPEGGTLSQTYIGPSFIGRFKSDKWLFKTGVGIGYFGYKEKGAYSTSSVGFSVALGAEYMLTPNIGLGVSLNTQSANLKQPEGTQLPDGMHGGMYKLDLQGGLRVYF